MSSRPACVPPTLGSLGKGDLEDNSLTPRRPGQRLALKPQSTVTSPLMRNSVLPFLEKRLADEASQIRPFIWAQVAGAQGFLWAVG